MRTLLICAMLIMSPAFAGQVFKCKGPKGEITYTNIKCPEDAPVVGIGHYEPEYDAPTASRREVDEPAESQMSRGDFPPNAAQVPSPTSSTERASGFRCDVEGRTWIQAAPCPLTSKRYERQAISGFTTTGDFVQGSASVPRSAPVRQDEMSRSDLCDQLALRTRTAERQKSTDGAYERNKMRAANNCGR